MRIYILVISLFVSLPILAEDVSQNNAIQAEKKSSFKGLFYKVWNKFKSMSPKDERRVRKTTITAGIRGAESTSSILKPYWKDDKTSDVQFMQQLEEFAQAQTLADKGDISASYKAFRGFIDKWPDSDLKPNAQFAEALTRAAVGDEAKSRELFNIFLKEYSDHPLATDAQEVLLALK